MSRSTEILNLMDGYMPYKLYCDLDGVLTGFNERYFELFGKSPDEETNKVLFKNIGDNSKDFWFDMPWEKGGQILWNFIKPYKPIILSSPTYDPFCVPGKMDWVHKNLGEDVLVILKNNKSVYANPSAILIDDRSTNIDKWVEHGGIGILYSDVDKAIKELKILIENK